MVDVVDVVEEEEEKESETLKHESWSHRRGGGSTNEEDDAVKKTITLKWVCWMMAQRLARRPCDREVVGSVATVANFFR